MLSNQLNLLKARPIILTISCCLALLSQSYAQCTSQLGELKVLNDHRDNGIFICHNDTLKVEVDHYELMDSQQLYYVYHIGEDILNSDYLKVDTMETDGLVNDHFATDTVYVTTIVSKLAISDWLQDSCIVFSNTIEAKCLEYLSAEYDERLLSLFEYEISLQLNGGLPELDSSLYHYVLTGDLNDSLSFNQIGRYIINSNGDESLIINIKDENGCSLTLSPILSTFFFPVELGSFTGNVIGNLHVLEWVTELELENDYFILEVCKDDFTEESHVIPGNGTTFQTNAYSFLNDDTKPGNYTYKLSNVSFDGKVLLLGKLDLITIASNLFPNPTQAKLSFQLQEMPSNLQIQIFDLTGKQILTFNETQIETNTLGFTINVSLLSNGIYVAQIQADDLERIEKFVVQQ